MVKLETICSLFAWFEIIGLITPSSCNVEAGQLVFSGFSIRLEVFVTSIFIIFMFIIIFYYLYFYLFLL